MEKIDIQEIYDQLGDEDYTAKRRYLRECGIQPENRLWDDVCCLNYQVEIHNKERMPFGIYQDIPEETRDDMIRRATLRFHYWLTEECRRHWFQKIPRRKLDQLMENLHDVSCGFAIAKIVTPFGEAFTAEELEREWKHWML